jgi:hypothetical protein
VVLGNGRMTGSSSSNVSALLQTLLQQQAAMLQVHAESLRLQRVLVDRLLGGTVDEHLGAEPPPASTALSTRSGSAAPETQVLPSVPDESEAAAAMEEPTAAEVSAAQSIAILADRYGALAAPSEQNTARGARYYESRPPPGAKAPAPEQVELMRMLQEMRDAGDLILQFGPYKSTTLAQVAMNHPEYVRQLVTRAQRPEVRAAAGRLVQALDAASEHKRRTTRGTTRKGRSR